MAAPLEPGRLVPAPDQPLERRLAAIERVVRQLMARVSDLERRPTPPRA